MDSLTSGGPTKHLESRWRGVSLCILIKISFLLFSEFKLLILLIGNSCLRVYWLRYLFCIPCLQIAPVGWVQPTSLNIHLFDCAYFSSNTLLFCLYFCVNLLFHFMSYSTIIYTKIIGIDLFIYSFHRSKQPWSTHYFKKCST